MPTIFQVCKPETESRKRPEETGETGHDAEEEKAKSKDGPCSMAHVKIQTMPGSSAPTSPLSPGGSGGLPSDSIENNDSGGNTQDPND